MDLFVWDFHGVLEKGNEYVVLELMNHVLSKNGYSRRLTAREGELLYGRRWLEYLQYLLPNEHNSVLQKLEDQCFLEQQQNLQLLNEFIRPNTYAHEVLMRIQRTHAQILISNTNEEMLAYFLEVTKLHDCFDAVLPANSLSKDNTKKMVLERFLRGRNIDRLISIGDAPTDIDLANVGIAQERISYLYTHPHIIPRSCIPTYYITDLREVLHCLSQDLLSCPLPMSRSLNATVFSTVV